MKNLKRFILVIVSVLLLSGCVKYNATLKIAKDKSMDFEVEMLLSKQLGEDVMSQMSTDEYEKLGFKRTNVTEGDYSGYKLTKTFKNIDDISSTTTGNVNFNDFATKENVTLFKVQKGFLKDTYTAKIDFEMQDQEGMGGMIGSTDEDEINTDEVNETGNTPEVGDTPEDGDTSETSDSTSDGNNISLDGLGDDTEKLTALMAEMEYKFNVSLPYAATKDNADNKTDDKNLTWSLTQTKTKANIEFEFPVYNITHIAILGGGALLIVIVLIVVIVVLKKKKKQDDTLIHTDYDQSIASEVKDNGERPISEGANEEVHENAEAVIPQPEVTQAPVAEQTPVTIEAPVVSETPAPEVAAVVPPMPVEDTIPNEAPIPEMAVETQTVTPEPVVEQTPVVEVPVAPALVIEPTPVSAAPAMASAPVIEPTPVSVAPAMASAPVVEPTPVSAAPEVSPMPVIEPAPAGEELPVMGPAIVPTPEVTPMPEVAPAAPVVEPAPVVNQSPVEPGNQNNLM